MAALTREQLFNEAINETAQYPNAFAHVTARDPLVLAQLSAQAAMLSMISQQLDVDKFEPFVKSRDGTVLADAALKGILPLGRACKVTLVIENEDTEEVSLGAQRRILDQKGRIYELDSSVTIAAGETATVTAQQIRRRSIRHSVVSPSDFYEIEVTLSADDMFLNTLNLTLGTDQFRYAPDWFNVKAGDMAYQVESDELRQMFVRLGKDSVVGYGVKTGNEFILDITECNGLVSDLAADSEFTLEYVYTAAEALISCKLVSVDDQGAAPHPMQELRVMARYPSIYDHNAVYLGEFTFLLRRYLSGIRFLSVWNEQVEEGVRGADVDNINCLFISGLVRGMTNPEFEARVTALIKRADDSYRLRFVPVEASPVTVTITGSIAISWDRASVEAQIRALMLKTYGDGSVDVSEGMAQPIKKARINRLLREQIDALRDENANYDVQLTFPATLLPEQFLFVSPASLSVTLTSEDYGTNLWNH